MRKRVPLSRLPAARTAAMVALAAILTAAVGPFAWPAPPAGTKSSKPLAPALFINSDPLGAVVVLDGKTLPSRTPLLLRDIPAGKHRLAVARKGYRPYFTTVEASAQQPTAVNVELKREYFEPVFSGGESVILDGKTTDSAKERYRLPEGQYRVSTSGTSVAVEPVYPARQIIKVVNLTTGALLTASAIMVAEAIFNPHTTGGPGSTVDLGPYIPVWILTGVSAISDIALHIQQSRYLKAYGASAVPIASTTQDAAHLYDQGQNMLVAGDLTGAAGYYIQIIQNSSDSLYYPRALYQLAKIDAIEGDNLLATAELRIILEKYPMADLYDRTCKSLADISYREGDYKLALSYLDKMVFLDPLFPRSQIAEYRATIEQKISQAGGGS